MRFYRDDKSGDYKLDEELQLQLARVTKAADLIARRYDFPRKEGVIDEP